jgi:hypothetical protein
MANLILPAGLGMVILNEGAKAASFDLIGSFPKDRNPIRSEFFHYLEYAVGDSPIW